jgi:uncharacterized membrane protein YphA (DoxX/SURF4 family)
MKKVNLYYWIVTGVMSALLLLSAIPDITKSADALGFFKHLGYPEYLLPFIGVMKVLGVVAVLLPKYTKLKEWAYAGLTFDTFGALYSHFSSGDGVDFFAPALVGLILVLGSYVLWNLKIKTDFQVQ